MKPPHTRRGVTLVMAVAVLGLIGVTMAMLLTMRANDFKRLAAERDDAQHQQLRLALIATAHAQIASGRTNDGPIALPEGLGGASINWSGTTATLTLDQTQTAVTFEKTLAGWVVREN